MATTNGTNGVNGVNGHANTPPHEQNVPATSLLAAFVANATTDCLTPAMLEKLHELLIDYIGVVVGARDNADSTEPIYAAIRALQGPQVTGPCTVLGMGAPHMLPQYAGLLNSAFGHSMDFDDTHVEGPLHPGVTAISAAMTQAELLGSSSSSLDFLLAMAIGYEITVRVGRELDYSTYDRGFHLTSIAGIYGAVASIAVLKHLDAKTVEMAWGLAGSKAAGSMQYLDNGSWNKRLHPGFAVHDAFMCVGLAEAGVIGATRIFEGKMGFLQAYSPNPNQDMRRLTAGLGTEWLWPASSLKPYPACRMTHGFIELSGNMHTAAKGGVSAADVSAITLSMSPACFKLIGDPSPNKKHPNNVIDGQFSAYFQVANALAYGSKTGLQAYSRLSDEKIHALCDKITVKIVTSMKGFEARMDVQWADGRTDQVEQLFPLGETQHPFTRDKVDEKFFSLAVPVYGEAKSRDIITMVDSLEKYSVEQLLVLLR